MSSSMIEQTREVHQQREQLTQQVIETMLQDARSDRARVVRDTAARRTLDELEEVNAQLLHLYDDADGTRGDELRQIGGDKVFTEFYERLKQTRDQHRKLAALKASASDGSGNAMHATLGSVRAAADGGVVDAPAAAARRMAAIAKNAGFSTAESHGRFLDLQSLHERFLNQPVFHEAADAAEKAAAAAAVAAEAATAVKTEPAGGEGGDGDVDMAETGGGAATAAVKTPATTTGRGKTRVSYLRYLTLFYKLPTAAPVESKLRRHYTAYHAYASDMLTYLVDFFARTHPLVDCAPIHKMIDDDFASRWDNGEVAVWQTAKSTDASSSSLSSSPASSSSPSASADLFCAPCQRSFAKATVMAVHMKSKGHKKKAATFQATGGAVTAAAKEKLRRRQLALLETKVAQFANLCGKAIAATHDYCEKRQTRTVEELAAEMEEEEREAEALLAGGVVDDSDEEDENAPIYNPKKLPLGWDGKPIPYWLYRLHGLNREFKCNICGGFSYWGERAYRRHFQDWRHNYGMRCLEIPNTKEFHHIVEPEDAKALWAKMQASRGQGAFDKEDDEEFEDDDGNVYNKKTFEDLKRQGII
jgi:splicing factor 3A subunit 3